MYAVPLVAIAALAIRASALPAKRFDVGILPCDTKVDYSIASVSPEPILGNTHSIVAMTCDGTGGSCTLGATYTYSVTTDISVGAALNLDPAKIQGNAGLTVGYSHSTTQGHGDSASFACPDGPWICGVEITPWVKEVSGTQKINHVGRGCPATDQEKDNNFTIQFPQTIDDLPNVNANLCACPNGSAGSLQAKGAPKPCPVDC